MAAGLPVIASEWGGPADYLDDRCGILVPLTSREDAVRGFAAAMAQLAADPSECEALGRRGLERVLECYDWERKGDQILEIYAAAVRRYAAQPASR